MYAYMQDGLLILVMELMRAGTLRQALLTPGMREALQWEKG